MSIWELHVDADPHLCVQQADLRYFDGKFDGLPMRETWAPPLYDMLGKSKKIADFTSWQTVGVFLATNKARHVLENLSGPDLEFLPFDRIKGCELFAVNVLRMEDFLDMDRTEFMTGAPQMIKRAAWKNDLPLGLPPIFKTNGCRQIYVSKSFAEEAVKHDLTGLSLADPGKSRFEQIVRRDPINEYPGLGSVPN